jgi:hypothetical protein
MNTYTVTYYPSGPTTSAPVPVVVSVVAKEFVVSEQFVVFVDDSTPGQSVFAVPIYVSPVIQLTAPAAS